MKKYLVTLFAVFFACAGQQGVRKQNATVTPPPDQTREPAEKMMEDFDPLTLEDYQYNIDVPVKEDIKPVSVEDILDKKPVDREVAEDGEISGFRIQIFSSRDEKEALLERRDALTLFDVNVYIEYDNPLWKVRLGDCVTRFEANELLERVRDRGYRDAWVVRTHIEAPADSFE